jgi:hypothetical protein
MARLTGRTVVLSFIFQVVIVSMDVRRLIHGEAG